MVLDEGAVAELDGRPSGDVVQAVLGYAVSPPRRRSSGIRPEQGPNTTEWASGKRPVEQTASNMFYGCVLSLSAERSDTGNVNGGLYTLWNCCSLFPEGLHACMRASAAHLEISTDIEHVHRASGL